MNQKIFKDHIPDAERKACYDCRFHQLTLAHWWCESKEGQQHWGTNQAQAIQRNNCPAWEPALTEKDVPTFKELTDGEYILFEGDNK